jgi:hypothetical protein
MCLRWTMQRSLLSRCRRRCACPCRCLRVCAAPGCGARRAACAEEGGDGTSRGAAAPLLTCSACRAISYCSAEHQRAHWREHKRECASIAASTAAAAQAPPRAAE